MTWSRGRASNGGNGVSARQAAPRKTWKRWMRHLILALSSALLARAASADTVQVTTTTDENDGCLVGTGCSLREAIAVASSGDTVLIPAGTYTLLTSCGAP